MSRLHILAGKSLDQVGANFEFGVETFGVDFEKNCWIFCSVFL